MSEIAIRAENLSKAYKIYERYSKDFYALCDINFEIRRGENVGLVGKNGAELRDCPRILPTCCEEFFYERNCDSRGKSIEGVQDLRARH